MAKPRIGDEEKKRRGTFRADESEAVLNAKAGAKVITGIFLPKVPDPEMPLNAVGRAKYDEIAALLFEQNKLTKVTCMDCEILALHWQGIQARIEAGKAPSSDSLKQFASITQRLRIAEDAPAIADPTRRNKFDSIGNAAGVLSTFRLRKATAA